MEKKAVGGGGEGRDNAKEHFDDWINGSGEDGDSEEVGEDV